MVAQIFINKLLLLEISLLLNMTATESVLGEFLLVQLCLYLPILCILLVPSVDIEVIFHVLKVAVHHFVLVHIAHYKIHAVVHIRHAHLLEPH